MSLGETISEGSSVEKILLHLNGNSNDDSGNGLNGTAYNTVIYSKNYGRYNEGAGNFAANTGCIYWNDNNKFDLTTFTISLWFKVFNTWDGTIISKFKGAQGNLTNYYIDTAGGSNRLRLFFAANGVFYNTTINKSLNSNQWYYLVITAGSGNVKAYIDSQLINTISYTGTITTNDYPLVIGGRHGSFLFMESFLDGAIDEVRLRARILTAQEIQKKYTNSLGRFASL